MKTALEVINEIFYEPYIIVKDRGNRGYYVLTKGFGYKKYDYISKKEIVSYIFYNNRYRYRDIGKSRKEKLITLKIMEE